MYVTSENFYEPAVEEIGYQVDNKRGDNKSIMTCPSNNASENEWGKRVFNLDGNYFSLSVKVSDPEICNLAQKGVQYKVTGDDRELAIGTPTKDGVKLKIDVQGIHKLTLESSTGNFDQSSKNDERNQNYCDEVWWINPEVK